MKRFWIVLVMFGVLAAIPVNGQGTLSNQVLRLLVTQNTWTALQTFDSTVGVKVGRASVPLGVETDKLENIGGNLYFNGTLLASAAASGTVSSVGLTLPGIFSVAGSPVTSSGTLAATLATEVANRVWAGPASGSDATPTFRALVAADIPAISGAVITSGVVAAANGGTGISSGNSGGVLAFTGSTTVASSATLAMNQIVLGGGAGAVPATLGSLGSATTLLHGGAGAPTFGAVVLTTDVSGILPLGNGGLGIALGVSGALPYFSSTSTVASSALLVNHALIVGGGAGAAPASLASVGTATTLLHGNASTNPTFSAVDLTADVTGVLPIASGGLNISSYTVGDILYASGVGALSKLADVATGNVILSGGVSTAPLWGKVGLTTHVSGALPVANGGTALTATPTNGQLPIGNGTNYTLATITGTANQVTVTNGSGTITLSTPQAIATGSTPQFTRLGLGAAAGGAALITGAGQFDLGYVDDGNSGTADTINWNGGPTHKSTLTGNPTYTFTNPIAGNRYTLVLIQDATGSRTVTWPGSVLWSGASAPTLTTTATKKDICTFVYDGTNYFGSCVLNY